MSRAAGERTSKHRLDPFDAENLVGGRRRQRRAGAAAELLELCEHQAGTPRQRPNCRSQNRDRAGGIPRTPSVPRTPRRSAPTAPPLRSDRCRRRSSAQTADSRRARRTPAVRPRPDRHSPPAGSSTAPAPAYRTRKSDPESARDQQRPGEPQRSATRATPAIARIADARVLVSMRYRAGSINWFPSSFAIIIQSSARGNRPRGRSTTTTRKAM